MIGRDAHSLCTESPCRAGIRPARMHHSPRVRPLVRSGIVAALAWAAMTTAASALQVGDVAPPLKISDWIRGESLDLAKAKGKSIVVVEFWATWCPPCRASIPHLSELQTKFKDKSVIIVGVSAEPPETIRPFITNMSNKITYTIAADQRQATSQAYLGGLGINGIPHACVVDKEGKLAWHGPPMGGLGRVLEEMVAGKYDMESAKRTAKAKALLDEYFGALLMRLPNISDSKERKQLIDESAKVGRTIVDLGGKDPEVLVTLAVNILDLQGLENRDVELASMAAQKAFVLIKPKDNSVPAERELAAATADIYARVVWMHGYKKEAVEAQKFAAAWAPNEQWADQLRKTLRQYETTDPPVAATQPLAPVPTTSAAAP